MNKKIALLSLLLSFGSAFSAHASSLHDLQKIAHKPAKLATKVYKLKQADKMLTAAYCKLERLSKQAEESKVYSRSTFGVPLKLQNTGNTEQLLKQMRKLTMVIVALENRKATREKLTNLLQDRAPRRKSKKVVKPTKFHISQLPQRHNDSPDGMDFTPGTLSYKSLSKAADGSPMLPPYSGDRWEGIDTDYVGSEELTSPGQASAVPTLHTTSQRLQTVAEESARTEYSIVSEGRPVNFAMGRFQEDDDVIDFE